MSTKGSFAQRMASMASAAASVENWDDDGDFQGDLFTHSVSTIQSMSSRVSVRSESNTGDDDWQVLLAPNDDLSTANAITSAKQAGIPIPTSVPSSALLGGSIKRLGKKKKSHNKLAVDDDWGNDLELPSMPDGGLKLKTPTPRTPADDQDDFDDWGEGSLGIRFGGTRREARGGRSSSVSAMSPSMGSCMTVESEDDDLLGLVLPTEPLDFHAKLDRLKRSEHPTPDVSPLPAPQRREPPPTSAPALALAPSPLPPPTSTPPTENEPLIEERPKLQPQPTDEDDFLDGLDFGNDEVLDTRKLTLNRNVQIKKPSPKPVVPSAARPATTLTFTDKPSVSRIPRPLPSNSRTRLTPVYETGAATLSTNRFIPTTTSAQLLKAKRSAPVLRNNYGTVTRAPVPFLPAGTSSSQSHHVTSKSSQPHLRRDSDPRRPQSPSMRSYSRMSASNPPDTPSRSGMRRDLAPASLAREATLKRTLSRPTVKRAYGDGNELEIFDDLPTSATKEKQFEKAPRNTQGNKTIRHIPSNSRLPMLDRMATPLPQTPRSPTKMDSTPRFARDTAASRNAREQRLAGTRSRGDGPIAPTMTNWKAQVAARSPHASPTAHRKRGSGQKPHLITAMSMPKSKNEKGMVYNPTLQRWEGNEDALAPFSHPNTSTTTLALTTASTPTFAPPNNQLYSHDRSHSISHIALSSIHQRNPSSRTVKVAPQPSPPRALPGLIKQGSTPKGVQVAGNMVFDPKKMCWMKMPRVSNGDPRSPSVDMDDEEDPFAGLEDLKDHDTTMAFGASTATAGAPQMEEVIISEEFDLGPTFIRRQREEEEAWRRKTAGWVGSIRDDGNNRHGGWRWQLRNLAESGLRSSFTDAARR
ncbi:hypothetical protein K491DRAFT_701742 [Lophiostoma macrostomum CBS 122681]|uniref:Cytokinesis regulator n=1 Tax=Lophiostoma macrostomum CBS 122681 TaxID=1314788 RepID=A0A6A6TJC8_9PLEO|nr:hypothetical protein K491DRAFT_701742 [Lophiostoma macrostomum CBS 122681]